MDSQLRAPMPSNTLTNADGTPYAAGHDSAIDQQKLQASRYAGVLAQRLTMGFSQTKYAHLNGDWSRLQLNDFRDFLAERLEPDILAILQEANKQ